MGGIVYVFHPYTGCKVIENKETDTVQQGFTLSFFYLVMKYQIGKKYAISPNIEPEAPALMISGCMVRLARAENNPVRR